MGMVESRVQSGLKAIACVLLFSLVSCGVPTESSDVKVVGGDFVKPNSLIAKHTVALLDSKLRVFCSGTIVNDEFVLTAAHCVTKRANVKFIGFHNDFYEMSTKTKLDVIKNKLRKVAGIYEHEDFELDPGIFGPKYILTQDPVEDIALIRFKGGYPESHKAVELATSDILSKADTVYMAGFGLQEGPKIDPITGQRLRPENPVSGQLKFVRTLVSLEHEKAQEISTEYFGNAVCNGDSGGPMFRVVKEGAAKKLVQVGIASRSNCISHASHTNVFSYMDWIQKTIDEESTL